MDPSGGVGGASAGPWPRFYDPPYPPHPCADNYIAHKALRRLNISLLHATTTKLFKLFFLVNHPPGKQKEEETNCEFVRIQDEFNL